MPINPEVIRRWLHAPTPWTPIFKGAKPAQLNDWIHDCSGRWLRTRTEPRFYQLEGLAMALYHERALLFFDMQLGKTKIGLDFAGQLKHGLMWRPPAEGKALIIAHAPIGVDVWETQSRVHSELRLAGIRSGPDARERFIAALSDDSDGIIIAWSMLQELFTVREVSKKGKSYLAPDYETLDIVAPSFRLVIIDEIHKAKDAQTLRFGIAEALISRTRWRLGLTGTPISRNPFSLWAQAYLIDEGRTLGKEYAFFEQAFAKPKQERNPITGRKELKFDRAKMPILVDKLSALAMAYQRSEVKKVEVLSGVVELKMYGDQREAYLNALDRIIKLKDGDHAQIKDAFTKLRQVSSGFLLFTNDDGEREEIRFDCNPKMEWLTDLLDGMTEELPTVIFHEFNLTGRLAEKAARAARWNYVTLNGRDDKIAYRRFIDGGVPLLISNTHSGGVSISLARAEQLIFLESPTSVIVRRQAEARPMARDRPLILNDVICAPIERRILDMIAEGKDLAAEIMGGKLRARLAADRKRI